MTGHDFHPEAVVDLDEIWDFIAGDNPNAADRVIAEILAAVDKLVSFPNQGYKRPDPVIWAHYSDKHRGLCLAFDIPDGKCRKIEYTPKRLKLPAKPELVDAEALLFTKYINWAYEREIRVWASLNIEEQGLYFSYFGDELRTRWGHCGSYLFSFRRRDYLRPRAADRRFHNQSTSRV